MSINLRIVLLVMVVIYLIIMIKEIRRRKLQLNFGISWILISIVLIIAACIPNFIEVISKALGFEVASNMIFCVTLFVSFYFIFILTLKISQENDKSRNLIQEISILKREVEELKEKIKNENK